MERNVRAYRKGIFSAALIVVAAHCHGGSLAQEAYPTRLVKMLVPYPPGGLPDTVARITARKMEAIWKQPVVVENRPGASGGLTATALLSAPADGYTLLVTEGSILYNSLIIKKLNYDWRDIAPAAQLARAPQFLAVNAKVSARTLQEFIAYVRSVPGKVNYGSAGIGSPHHLAMESMKSALKLDMVHVPYKGANEATPALLGGHIDALWIAYPSIVGSVKKGQISLLAINSTTRSGLAPDVPPMADLIPGFDTASIVGIFLRSGTPAAIVDRIAQAAIEAASDPDVKEKLLPLGVEAAGLSSRDYTAALHRERERIRKVVEEANIRVE
jgi:tripartite-type tricarboxylate transporter receptor subunit TctC